MSLARQFFREMRPLFRMLEEPFSRHPSYLGAVPMNRSDPFDDMLTRPAVDISDRGDNYILDADLPGVPKENVEIRVGDSGRSITIEGKVTERGGEPKADSSAVMKSDETSISTERPYKRNVSFMRTVWLPRPIDAKDVSAKMQDGVLSITVKKADDKMSTVVPID